jgi:hypothetical protein
MMSRANPHCIVQAFEVIPKVWLSWFENAISQIISSEMTRPVGIVLPKQQEEHLQNLPLQRD